MPIPQADNHAPSLGPIRALAATARLANVPSVLSNIGLGILPAMLVGEIETTPDFVFRTLCVALSGVFLYVFGGFLNDWADRSWDAVYRPERALPRGLYAAGQFLSLAVVLVLVALFAAWLVSLEALVTATAIAICVMMYTWLHKRSAMAMVFMGLCRALLPVLGWCVFASTGSLALVIGAAIALWFHVAGISVMARMESLPRPITRRLRWDAGFFIAAGLAAFVASASGQSIVVCLAAFIPYAAWTAFCLFRVKPLPAKVSGLLAGIPLVDLMLLVPVALLSSVGMPVIAASLSLPMLAFIAGKTLQRFTPAT